MYKEGTRCVSSTVVHLHFFSSGLLQADLSEVLSEQVMKMKHFANDTKKYKMQLVMLLLFVTHSNRSSGLGFPVLPDLVKTDTQKNKTP